MTQTASRPRKNPAARAAALEWVESVTQAELDKLPTTRIPFENPNDLEARVNTGVLEASIGALLLQARQSRVSSNSLSLSPRRSIALYSGAHKAFDSYPI